MSISIENVSKRFGDFVALDGVSLEVPTGSLVALLGPSGSGKSTLLRIVAGLEQADSGTIHIAEEDVTASSPQDRGIGFVFQQYNLLPALTAAENAAIPLVIGGWHRARAVSKAREVLEQIGMGGRTENLPAQLSGGQQQRVAIARALINNPTLLLADEPTGNLNSEAGDGILEALVELHRAGMSIVMVTHDPRVAATAERRIVMQDGKMVRDEAVLERTKLGMTTAA